MVPTLATCRRGFPALSRWERGFTLSPRRNFGGASNVHRSLWVGRRGRLAVRRRRQPSMTHSFLRRGLRFTTSPGFDGGLANGWLGWLFRESDVRYWWFPH